MAEMKDLLPADLSLLPLLNLRRLLILRSMLIIGWLIALVIMYWWAVLAWPWFSLLVVGCWLASTGQGLYRLRRHGEVSEHEFLVQILIDVVALAILLFLTGGAANPFTLLLLLPLTVAAAVLPAGYSWLVAAVMIICYSVLLLTYVIPQTADETLGERFGWHVLGMWGGFVVAAVLIAAFVVRMGATLREHDRALARVREQALRDEHLVALGALAAGAAHELATPLGTMAVLAKELEEECSATDECRERLVLLQSQVTRCKQTLASLSASAGQNRAEAGYRLPLDRYLDEVVSQWRAMRPAVHIIQHGTGTTPVPVIIAEQTLTQALLSILNNAADASPQAVELEAYWTAECLVLDICDRGHGLTPSVSATVGRRPFTTKTEGKGMGLGLYLAHGVITRLGGEMHLFNRAGGGACVHLELPLAKLLVKSA